MNKISRRALAYYATEQLAASKSASAVAKDLAATLVESGRTNEVEFLLSDIAAQLEERGELAVATVTSATKLTPQLRTMLSSQLKKSTGVSDVMIEEKVDKRAIGGARIEIATRVWDQTIARKLTALREMF